MNPLLKVLIALAVVLPLGGFVAGSLASATDDPPPRPPIELTDPPASSGTDRPTSPEVVSPRPRGADGDDRDDDGRRDRGGDDPPDLDDDDEPDDDERDDDERDDDEGDDDDDGDDD